MLIMVNQNADDAQSKIEPTSIPKALSESSLGEAMCQEELLQYKLQNKFVILVVTPKWKERHWKQNGSQKQRKKKGNCG
ncbi:hypothetical protein Tco_0637050 [Tanacetum coccineum]